MNKDLDKAINDTLIHAWPGSGYSEDNATLALTELKASYLAYKTANHREQFEEKVFRERYLKSIKRNVDKPKNAMDFVSVDCPSMSYMLRRDDKDNYEDEFISAMWFGYQLALKD